jgi:hypothetical protein
MARTLYASNLHRAFFPWACDDEYAVFLMLYGIISNIMIHDRQVNVAFRYCKLNNSFTFSIEHDTFSNIILINQLTWRDILKYISEAGAVTGICPRLSNQEVMKLTVKQDRSFAPLDWQNITAEVATTDASDCCAELTAARMSKQQVDQGQCMIRGNYLHFS